MTENCLDCLYSSNNSISILVNDMLSKHKQNYIKAMKCDHINSPFYKELITEKTICRLFIDAQEYFKMKDRRENIEELLRKIKGQNF